MDINEQILQAQQVTDLRARMLKNLAEGKSSIEGISREEISRAISTIRSSGRQRAAEAATKGRKAAAKGKGKSDAPATPEFFAGFGLDSPESEA